MFTVYVPAVNPLISSVVAPLLQTNVYGKVPPVTVKSNEPVASPKQSTFVTAIPELRAVGSLTVVVDSTVQRVVPSVTVTVYEPATKPVID